MIFLLKIIAPQCAKCTRKFCSREVKDPEVPPSFYPARVLLSTPQNFLVLFASDSL